MSERERSAGANTPLPATETLVAAVASTEAPAAPHVPRRRRKGDGAKPPAVIQSEHVILAEESAPAPPTSRGGVGRDGITVEHLLYLAILAFAIFTRFWDLGAKALHHDESLHAYYSWLFETGGGYRHHPLMHGPFLFHANALVYLLFGDSDATSRYMPALFGVVLVGLPYLLRGPRFLGRWGALVASFLILISPVLLYQSRYIRHDIYTVTGTLLLFICIVRYLEESRRRWLVIGAGAVSFLLTNHEIIFAILVIFGGVLWAALLFGRMRVWWQAGRRDLVYNLLGLHAGVAALGLALALFMPRRFVDRIYDIPWQNPTSKQQFQYYQHLLVNPLVLGLLLILIGYIVGVLLLLRAGADPDRIDESRLDAVFGPIAPHTPEYGIAHAWRDKHGLWIAAFVFLAIFVTLYTSLYTNLYGLVSSTVATDGTLLYWLGQHDYRRGEQPWFYFLVLFPQYEFIAVTLGTAMAGVTAVRAVGSLFGVISAGRNLFFRLFLTAWLAGIFAGLSYAGEKMPWLVSHITLPATLLAAVLIGGVIERIAVSMARTADQPGRVWGWPEWSLVALLGLAALSWFVLAARLTLGEFVDSEVQRRGYSNGGWTRVVDAASADRWWLLAVPFAVAAAAIVVMVIARGASRAALASLAALVLVLVPLQVHGGWALSFNRPDIPTEMMIYTQTSPDVVRVMREITALSEELTGGNGIEIWYDSGVSWPLQWYLRDFPNKRFVGGSISSADGDPAIVLAQDGNLATGALSNYTPYTYVLRWWFPENQYRDFTVAPELDANQSAALQGEYDRSIGGLIAALRRSLSYNLGSADAQARLYRLLMYRETEWPLGQYNFTLYVRNDLVPLFNAVHYGS